MTRAFLVGINQDRSDDDMERSMAELKGLVRACEIEPCYNLVQNIKEINKSTLIGKGKLEEINELLKLIADHRRKQEFECDIELPYDRMNIYSYLKENGEILSQKYTEKGIRMKVRCRERDKNILKAYL